ncbi:MAG: hypothetical protein PHY45_03985 [Rhodocyclaceae bacterium]|nr:hypothetical protein [Rhodocyclaceae bacterium]
MRADWQQLAEGTKALAASTRVAADIRSLAETTTDLLELFATWPVPRQTGLEYDLARSLFRLCEHSGQALCNEGHCPTRRDRAAGTVCRLIVNRWKACASESFPDCVDAGPGSGCCSYVAADAGSGDGCMPWR